MLVYQRVNVLGWFSLQKCQTGDLGLFPGGSDLRRTRAGEGHRAALKGAVGTEPDLAGPCRWVVASGKHTKNYKKLLKMAIYSGFSHYIYKIPFSIAM